MVSQKSRVVGIALITAIGVMGDSMLFVVLPIYWEEFGLTALWQIGILLSINRFIRLPINPLVGLFYQHYQIRTGMFFAVILAVLTTMSYGLLHQFWLLVIMRALWGVAWSLLRLGGYLTVIDVANHQNRGNYVGLYNGLWGLGGLVGMLAGGLLVDQTSVVFVTSLFALVGLLVLPAISFLVPGIKHTKNEEEKEKDYERANWFTPYIGMVLLTGMSMGFIVFGLFASTLSPLIERVYTDEWTILQITLGAATLAGMIQAIRWGWDPFIAPLVGKILDSAKSMVSILFIPLFGGGILLIFLGNIESIIILIVGLLVFQLISTMFVTTTDTLATSAAARTDRVKMITAHTVVVDVGAALGPFVSYLILELYSLTAIYYISGSLLILLGGSWFIFNRRRLSE
ncbi:MFS transporter [Salinibacillus aidingensis]|uniref:MFS transporter n=1 Tax=Salinibacillus aidingensis TaxID=237684 RepID=A0ABP3KMH7_9BACI